MPLIVLLEAARSVVVILTDKFAGLTALDKTVPGRRGAILLTPPSRILA
jgi:hypothetical protein